MKSDTEAYRKRKAELRSERGGHWFVREEIPPIKDDDELIQILREGTGDNTWDKRRLHQFRTNQKYLT